MKKLLLLAALLLGLRPLSHADTPPLAAALNPDGTLKPGVCGAFDARRFRMSTGVGGRPEFRPMAVAGAGDERWQAGFGVPTGVSGSVLAVLRVGADLYVAGQFGAVHNTAARNVARWDGTAWYALGAGIDGRVFALAAGANGELYAGGLFAQAGSGAARNVARWDGAAWRALGAGLGLGTNPGVYALAVTSAGNLYATGAFAQAGAAVANNVARWDGAAWSPLGTGAANGLQRPAGCLALAPTGELYVGGNFTQAGGATANYVARWNGTAWSPLGAGTSGNVWALAVAPSGDLYVGGDFTRAGTATANYVARWNGRAWSSLGTGAANGMGSTVGILVVAANGDVVAGGNFLQAGGATARRVARWNGSAWQGLGAGPGLDPTSTTDRVTALLAEANGAVTVGGRFTLVGGAVANGVARWDGTAWAYVGQAGAQGVDGIVNAVVVAPNGDVYVGGNFFRVGQMAARNVARWDGTAWHALGAGLRYPTMPIAVEEVRALAVGPAGDLYAGGRFTYAGAQPVLNVARWDGTAWHALGAGAGTNLAYVYALAVAPNGTLYAGGSFSEAGGVPASNVARWNGSTWGALGAGVGGAAAALAVAPNGDLYAGGGFVRAGGVPVNYVARWDGTAWNPLGTPGAYGVGGVVQALAVGPAGDLYVGGAFAQAGGVPANNVARWNVTGWSSLGAGVAANGISTVMALALAPSGDLYVGGDFVAAGGQPASRFARWNGAAWQSLGTGLDWYVYALATGGSGQVYAGGWFSAVGDGSRVSVRFGVYDPSAPLRRATAAPAATPVVLYPNPACGSVTLRLPPGARLAPLALADLQGRVLRRYSAQTSPETTLRLDGLPAGVYVVRGADWAARLVVE